MNQSTASPSIGVDGESQTSIYTSNAVDVSLRLEGPYFTVADPSRYKTVVCFVAGTGVSGAIAIARAFLEQKREKMAAFDNYREGGAKDGSAKPSLWERCVVFWTVREENYIDLPYLEGRNQFRESSLYTRYTDTGFV